MTNKSTFQGLNLPYMSIFIDLLQQPPFRKLRWGVNIYPLKRQYRLQTKKYWHFGSFLGSISVFTGWTFQTLRLNSALWNKQINQQIGGTFAVPNVTGIWKICPKLEWMAAAKVVQSLAKFKKWDEKKVVTCNSVTESLDNPSSLIQISKVVSTHPWNTPLNLYQQAIKGFLS